MKNIFFKESDKLDKMKEVIKFHKDAIIPEDRIKEMEENDEDVKVIRYPKDPDNENDYITLEVVEKLPEDSKILGYARISDKENKKIKAKINDLACSVAYRIAVNEKKKLLERVVGYVKVDTIFLENYDTEGKDVYVALTKFFVVPIIIIIGMVGLVGTVGYIEYQEAIKPIEIEKQDPDVSFKDGDKNSGEIEDEAHEFGQAVSFRMKLNCTPGVEIIDGKQHINLRLESPKKDNEGLGFITKVYLLQKVDNEGNVIEDYSADPIEIYESPQVFADENIEYCPLDKYIESGTYVGRALYYVFDEDLNMLGQTASRLRITCP